MNSSWQKDKKSNCNIYTDDAFCMGGQPCKPSMVDYGKDIASRGRNLFVSAESFAEMTHEDMGRLSQFLEPWKKVTIVVFYRRYFDWLPSSFNQITKKRMLKDSQLWETSIVDFIESNVDHVRPIYTTELVNRLMKESTFDNVVVMNLQGPDLSLFCNEALNMTHTCDGLKATKQLNSGVDNMDYSDLAFAASRAGLIDINTDSKMKRVAQAFHKHQKDATTFKRICPSADVLDKLWNMTLAFELELFPDSAVDQTLEEMRQDFNEASQAKLCKIDVDETLKDPLWLDFIKTLDSSITQQSEQHSDTTGQKEEGEEEEEELIKNSTPGIRKEQVQVDMPEQTITDDGDTTNPFIQMLLENREPKCSIRRRKDMQSPLLGQDQQRCMEGLIIMITIAL